MSWIVLVDGYNVLQNWPQFTRDLEERFDLARERLTRMIADFAAYQGHRVIVVFDAQRQNLRKAVRKKLEGIEVVYTQREQTADAYIIQWMQRYKGEKHVEVITSDRALSDAVHRLGASVRTTFEFSDTYARTGGSGMRANLQDAIPNSAPRLGDLIDPTVRQQLEQLKRELGKKKSKRKT